MRLKAKHNYEKLPIVTPSCTPDTEQDFFWLMTLFNVKQQQTSDSIEYINKTVGGWYSIQAQYKKYASVKSLKNMNVKKQWMAH